MSAVKMKRVSATLLLAVGAARNVISVLQPDVCGGGSVGAGLSGDG